MAFQFSQTLDGITLEYDSGDASVGLTACFFVARDNDEIESFPVWSIVCAEIAEDGDDPLLSLDDDFLKTLSSEETEALKTLIVAANVAYFAMIKRHSEEKPVEFPPMSYYD